MDQILNCKKKTLVIDPSEISNKALWWAVKVGHLDIVKLLLPMSDPKADESEALYLAAQYAHTDIVELLLPLSDANAEGGRALRAAAAGGNLDVVKLIFSVTKPENWKNAGLSEAAASNHVSVVEFLLSVINKHADLETALVTAAHCGFNDICRLLLPKSTVDQMNRALYWATHSDQISTIDLLYPRCDMDCVLQKFEKRAFPSEGITHLKQIAEAAQTKAFLNENIQNDKPRAPSKKM